MSIPAPMPTLFNALPENVLLRHITYDDEAERNWRALLCESEIKRRAAMKSEERRRSFTLGRMALRGLLGQYLGVGAQDVPLVIEPSGRLSCPDSGLYLSLAHSGDQAVAVASTRNLGVDIELIRSKPEALLDYILADEEKEHIHGLGLDTVHALFLCWTLKECVLKALGTGLRRSPRKVRLSIDLSNGSAVAIDPEGKAWKTIFQIQEFYVFALAYE